jgi:hypothetical protein
VLRRVLPARVLRFSSHTVTRHDLLAEQRIEAAYAESIALTVQVSQVPERTRSRNTDGRDIQ